MVRIPVAVTVLLALACGGGAPPPDPAPVAVDSTPIAEPIVVTRVDTVVARDSELEAKVSRLELQLAERDAELDALRSRLEETRGDVVLALGQIKTTATRAEAASAMAEAEIAVQGLQSAGGAELKDELQLAREQIARGNEAFAAQNYSGALYRATQAKNLVTATRTVLARSGRRPGERAFAVPVRFDVTSRANLRDAPGTNARLLATLERGAQVVAIGHFGEWLRVTDPAGREGWIFQHLVNRSQR